VNVRLEAYVCNDQRSRFVPTWLTFRQTHRQHFDQLIRIGQPAGLYSDLCSRGLCNSFGILATLKHFD